MGNGQIRRLVVRLEHYEHRIDEHVLDFAACQSISGPGQLNDGEFLSETGLARTGWLSGKHPISLRFIFRNNLRVTSHDVSLPHATAANRAGTNEDEVSSTLASRPDERLPNGGAGLNASEVANLQISEIRYRRLFEAARDGVLLIDPATRKITDVNPFMSELLGFSREAFLGKELWEIGLREDAGSSQEKFRELLERHFVRYENLPLATITGGTKDVEVVANLYQENDYPVIQCNVRDITERKATDKQLREAKNEISRHASELTRLVTERTIELQGTVGELEAFSYSISHDMRAPLRTMRGYSEILVAKHSAQLDDEGVGYLRRIGLAAARLDRLIQEVLTYTHLLRADIMITAIDLDPLVREIIDSYPQLQGGLGIEIEGILPKVLGAEASLVQCVANLLENAIKFVPVETKPRVKVWAERIGPEVRLWVGDNGVGIALDDQTRIFKMFEQVGRAHADGGMGMGLTIVSKAVERMGGQRGVESQVGQGSKFWIQLKAANP